ncbi:MAG: mycofactocin-coupled SDR family oxidoreductase [Actinobacteria bacterium]|nr:mycofactocin-coupled SDR family oxidoreductase [Actinomycetota bacterium]
MNPLHRYPRFDNRTYFVTGVARGQGRSHAIALASEGASIIGVDVCADVGTVGYAPATPEDLSVTMAEVEAAGGRIVARVADVRDADALGAVLEEGIGEFGDLDGVIANAGICSYGRLWELTDDQWRSVIDINLTGVFHTLRACVPALLDRATGHDASHCPQHDTAHDPGHNPDHNTGHETALDPEHSPEHSPAHDTAHSSEHGTARGASIVITASGAGIKPLPLLAHYSATKAGVIAMARSLAHELAAHHIRVNVVAPTAVKTPMGRDETLREVIAANPEATAAFGNLLPVGSVDPGDITEAVLWLLSDAARYVTGVVLPVDAGATVR